MTGVCVTIKLCKKAYHPTTDRGRKDRLTTHHPTPWRKSLRGRVAIRRRARRRLDIYVDRTPRSGAVYAIAAPRRIGAVLGGKAARHLLRLARLLTQTGDLRLQHLDLILDHLLLAPLIFQRQR